MLYVWRQMPAWKQLNCLTQRHGCSLDEWNCVRPWENAIVASLPFIWPIIILFDNSAITFSFVFHLAIKTVDAFVKRKKTLRFLLHSFCKDLPVLFPNANCFFNFIPNRNPHMPSRSTNKWANHDTTMLPQFLPRIFKFPWILLHSPKGKLF